MTTDERRTDRTARVTRRGLLRLGFGAGAAATVAVGVGGAAAAGQPASKPSTRPGGDVAQETFTNPLTVNGYPDPGVLFVDGTYYAYVTNGLGGNVPVLSSPDLVHWTYAGDAFPTLPSWSSPNLTWAPEVLQVDDYFVLYFTIRATGVDRQCIGRAIADSPLGPFVDDGQLPLICEDTEGGSIDASPFRDNDGSLYLYWKNDGNAIGIRTNIYGRPLTSDGLSMAGERVTLLTNNPSSWHGISIEAPWLLERDGRYYLFYSGNMFNTPNYGVGYAVMDTPLGPAADAAENPILSSVAGADGPGHCSVVTWPEDGSTWMLYHARTEADGPRKLWLDRVEWVDGKPDVQGPTTTPQPVPGS